MTDSRLFESKRHSATPSPWSHALLWVPSLYLAMGVPFNVVQGTAARMYQSLHVPKQDIALWLGWVGIIWSLKPIWAALLDMHRSKRFFVIGAQLMLSALFAIIAFSLTRPDFFGVTMLLLVLVAFVSATQDICADGIYITALDSKTQARLIGVQGMFWNLARFFAAGWLVFAVERLLQDGDKTSEMWRIILLSVSALMLLLSLFHYRVLPAGAPANRSLVAGQTVASFARTAASFVSKPGFWGMISFVLLYRVGEGLLLMQGPLFLQASTSEHGVGLSPGTVSSIDGGLGTVCVTIGGLLGGAIASTWTLPRALRWLGVLLNLPHLGYVLLATHAASGPVSLTLVATMVGIEKFGYGLGFVGNMLYMMQQLARGRHSMTHYAFGTALMNLVLVPTAMISGPLVELLHYRYFFWLVVPVSLISVWAAWRAPFPSNEPELTLPQPQNQRETPDEDDEAQAAELGDASALGTRASVYAMSHLLAFLILDSSLLGALRSDPSALPSWLWAALLLVLFSAKGYLTLRALVLAREALQTSKATSSEGSSRNARGARGATLVCAVLGILTLAAGFALLAS